MVSAERQPGTRLGPPRGALLFSRDFSQKLQGQSSTPFDPHTARGQVGVEQLCQRHWGRVDTMTPDNPPPGLLAASPDFKVAGMGFDTQSCWAIRGRAQGHSNARGQGKQGFVTGQTEVRTVDPTPSPLHFFPTKLGLFHFPPKHTLPCPRPEFGENSRELAFRGSGC